MVYTPRTKKITSKLQGLRIEAKKSLRQVSSETGIAIGYLCDLENSRNLNPSVDTLCKLASCYHKAPSTIMYAVLHMREAAVANN